MEYFSKKLVRSEKLEKKIIYFYYWRWYNNFGDDIVINKYTNIFKLCFISYVGVFLARPYITAQTWADIILLIFLVSCVYQLMYIIYLRKLDQLKVSFLRSITNYFLFFTYTIEIFLVCYTFYSFFFGYEGCFFLSCETYTGLEIFNSWFIFYYILIIPCIIYQILYYVILAHITKKRRICHNKKGSISSLI